MSNQSSAGQAQKKKSLTLLAPDRLEESFFDKKPLYPRGEAIAEAERCLYCTDAPCIKACPTEIDIPTFIKKIATDNIRGSAKTILDQNLLGYSCARVCPVEELCVGSCVYNGWGRDPIQIGRLQRYATENALAAGEKPLYAPKAKTGKKVVCVGAGPASLAFAGYLALEGHSAVILERAQVPGGLNTTGIAPYKLKAEDAVHEVEWVLDLGVELRGGVTVGGDGGPSGAELLSQYDAVFIGIGLGADTRLGVPGEDGGGVLGAIQWIEEMKLQKGAKRPAGRVLVIGGGNTAIDVARETALLGADVAMVYRRGKDEMSGYAHEMAGARKETVRLIEHAVVSSFVRDASGKLIAARLSRAAAGKPIPGSEYDVPCDLAVIAIGQSKLHALASEFAEVEIDGKGCIVVHTATCQTKNPKVFAGGDCINGGKEVVNAVADGRNAARFLMSQWSRSGAIASSSQATNQGAE
jgi:dihydropyrimidine dehydrogenase (NAD+) subunit PreT